MNAKSPRTAIYPGTFDPVTNGHLDLIRRGSRLFDQLIVAIGQNPTKQQLFGMAERQEMIEQVLAEAGLDVRVSSYKGLTADFARSVGATAMLRGIRNFSDLQFEFQLALTNRAVADVETVFILASEEYGFTSSSLIKQIAAGGEIDRLSDHLPPIVIDHLKQRIANGLELFEDHPDSPLDR
jgi:pantetheine-phosphate adenylyltransferase